MKLASDRLDETRASRPRILVVDADDQLCDLIGRVLRGPYAVASAPHGAAALELVKMREPALILLDPRLPIMDGWSFVQKYRRLAATQARIVAMSGSADLRHVAQQLHADAQLQKPFSMAALQELVRGQLADCAAERPVRRRFALFDN